MVKKRNREVINGPFTVVQWRHHDSLDRDSSSYLVWASLTCLLFHLLHTRRDAQLWVLFLQSTMQPLEACWVSQDEDLRQEGGGWLGSALGITAFRREKEGGRIGQRKKFNCNARSSEAGMILQSCPQLEWGVGAFIPLQQSVTGCRSSRQEGMTLDKGSWQLRALWWQHCRWLRE